MIKYISEYTNHEGLDFKIEIDQASFSGEPTEIVATAQLEYGSVSDVLECFRGSALRIDLEANPGLSFTDLYSENETEFKVKFYINGVVKFHGFIKPDGIYTDFVNEIYTISLDAVDGLGILKNLAYVKTDGNPYPKDFTPEAVIIQNCLNRTGLLLPINTNIEIFYDGIADEANTDITTVTKLSAERFQKDDGKTIMDCEEVLRSVLEKYNAIIHQQDGEWYIYRPLDMVKTGEINFYRYLGGIMVGRVLKTLGQVFGSYPDYPSLHHVNKNQRISIDGAISAYRVNYKYGVLKSFFVNSTFFEELGAINGWSFTAPLGWETNVNDDGGIRYEGLDSPTNIRLDANVLSVQQYDTVQLTTDLEVEGEIIGITCNMELTDGVDTYYFDGMAWQTTPIAFDILNYFERFIYCDASNQDTIRFGDGVLLLTIPIQSMPIAGDLSFSLVDIVFGSPSGSLPCYTPPTVNYIQVNSLKLEPQERGSGNELKQGEFHTATRVPKPSSIIKDNKTIYNGDSESDLWVGTIKKTDNTNTSVWHHLGVSESKPILQIMVEDTLIMSSAPSQVFTGDIYGHFDYLNVFEVNNITGRFVITNYAYNTLTNVTSMTLRQVYTSAVSGLEHEITYDYGKVTEPVIKS